ncbi:MAG: hypothetical protein HYU67_05910 [Flavobacteriia bacterium]|nr:hypothetical protein [Flavobacteriia bacterium]
MKKKSFINNSITSLILFHVLLSSNLIYSQSPDELIPKDAVSVLGINNISLLKKIPLDDLIQYDFMDEIHAELFDGSTSNKTLKDSGIDFDQKLHVFYGKNRKFELAGFTFGIKNKKLLFSVFDDFDKKENWTNDVELYSSQFNHLLIKGNSAIVLRIDPTSERVSVITDSIWLARGYSQYDYYQEEYYEGEEDELNEEEIFEEEIVVPSDSVEVSDYDLLNKTYWELRDSITLELQFEYFKIIMNELFLSNIHLKSKDKNFEKQLLNNSDGIFYLDNSRNFSSTNNIWYFQTLFPDLVQDIKEIYTGNVILGQINLNDNQILLNFDANYSERLGSIYEALTDTRFDKKVFQYIPSNTLGFITYNINLNKGYKQAFDVIVPVLEKQNDPRVSGNLLMIELINEFVNTEAVFNTYKGSMFACFNGIKKVKTKKIEFFYDEETFEYSEKESEGEEEMPIFTFGFSTNKNEIPEKILKYFSKMTSRFHKENEYWVVEEALFNSIPIYIINQNGLFIFTNDEDLAKFHTKGYGSASLSGIQAKKAKKSKFMYGHFNWGLTIDKLPQDMLSKKQNDLINAMKGKTGVFELSSSKTTKEKTSFSLEYTFEGNYEHSGKYLLDLINTVYVMSKD